MRRVGPNSHRFAIARSFIFVPEQLVSAAVHEVDLTAGYTIDEEIEILAAARVFFARPVLNELCAFRAPKHEDVVGHCHTMGWHSDSNQVRTAEQ
jgi:hypothetical protein